MPNTPVRVGRGVVGLVAGTRCSAEQLQQVVRLLDPVSTVIVMDESLIDSLTATSGSGPAYVFYLAESMMKAAMDLGLDRSTASTLVAETIAGSALLLAPSPTIQRRCGRQSPPPEGQRRLPSVSSTPRVLPEPSRTECGRLTGEPVRCLPSAQIRQIRGSAAWGGERRRMAIFFGNRLSLGSFATNVSLYGTGEPARTRTDHTWPTLLRTPLVTSSS